MSDERIAALRYFLDLDNPYLGVDQQRIMEGIAALKSLESQNQALQEEVKNKAAILNAIEALLDVDDEHTGWERIRALQERAEKAEASVRAAYQVLGFYDFLPPQIRERFLTALSPTQETDPE